MLSIYLFVFQCKAYLVGENKKYLKGKGDSNRQPSAHPGTGS